MIVASGSSGNESQSDRAGSSARPDRVDPRLVERHARQRRVSWLAAPFWIGLSVLVMRLYFGYRIANASALRAQYRAIRRQSDAPLLVCANHLTLIDSFLVAWSMGSPGYWLRHFDELPWNTPERTNFGRTWLARSLIFVAKCIPITRGGAREDVGDVLERVRYLLQQGETALLFPEAGRSRSGRVEESAAAWGVGRVVGSVPGCRVLCVYLRGRRQETWSDFPARGDVMEVSMSCIEPKSDSRGVRRSRDLAQQIVRELMRMEAEHLRDR